MKRFLVLGFLLLAPFIVYLGCSSNSNPTGPVSPIPTNTFTANSTLGTATNTPTITATLNPTLGTATYTFTPGPATSTFTPTETQLCGSPYNFGRNFTGEPSSALTPLTPLPCRYNLPVAGKVTKLHAYFPNTVGANFRIALYTNNGSAPQSLISQSNSQVSAGFWNTVDIPDTGTLAA